MQTQLDLISSAVAAADEILAETLRVQIRKSFDLSTDRGFDEAVAEFTGQLISASKSTDIAAVRAAVAALDVDWQSTTKEQRRALVNAAMEAAGRHTALIPSKIGAKVDGAADEVVRVTKRSLKKSGLSIAVKFNEVDKRIVAHLAKSQANYVTHEYGARVEAFGVDARRIVSDGLELGLGRADIAKQLEEAAAGRIIGRSRSYWTVVAGAFVGRGRSWSQLASYREASVERYQVEAVLDERTTEICRHLHGKTFSVGDGFKQFDRVEALEDPRDIRVVQPWVRESTDSATGERFMWVRGADGEKVRIATIETSGFGTQDPGVYKDAVSDQRLNDIGISFPPYHGLCRTTTIPVI